MAAGEGRVEASGRQVGRTKVRVPAIGFGTSGLGHMPATYGYGVDEERAQIEMARVTGNFKRGNER